VGGVWMAVRGWTGTLLNCFRRPSQEPTCVAPLRGDRSHHQGRSPLGDNNTWHHKISPAEAVVPSRSSATERRNPMRRLMRSKFPLERCRLAAFAKPRRDWRPSRKSSPHRMSPIPKGPSVCCPFSRTALRVGQTCRRRLRPAHYGKILAATFAGRTRCFEQLRRY
jgi:hypothetical protein